MAFETVETRTIWGDKKVLLVAATFTAVTTGTIVTGFSDIEVIIGYDLTDNSTAVVADITSTLGEVALSAASASDVMHFIIVAKQ